MGEFSGNNEEDRFDNYCYNDRAYFELIAYIHVLGPFWEGLFSKNLCY